jgi:cullin-associated NEDD8-dissociated protein 1
LAPLVKKVSEDRVVEMTNKLCDKLLNGKEQHRDTASIGLKTIIVEVTTPSLAEKILVSLAPQLISGVTSVRFFLYFVSCFPDFLLVVCRLLKYHHCSII